MPELDLSKCAIVSNVSGEKFFGEVGVDPNSRLWECVEKNKPILLKNARLMIVQYKPTNTGAIQSIALMVPIDIHREACTIHVKPSSWYLVTDGIKEDILKLVKAAENAEMINRAAKSGLHVAGAMPQEQGDPRGTMVR